MAEIKALFQRACVVKNRKHVALGDIKVYDDENDSNELVNLRAAGAIAPVTKDNVEKILEMISSAGLKISSALRSAARELKVEVPAEAVAK